MAPTKRYPIYTLAYFFLCPLLVSALALPERNQQVPLAQTNLAAGQYERKQAVGDPSTLPVDTAVAVPETHVVISFKDPEKAKSSKAYLRYMERSTEFPVQDAVRKVTVEGYPSLTDWTLVESALSRVQHLDEIHWHHEAAIPTSLMRSLEARHPACKLYYEMRFSNRDPFDENVPFVQLVGKEHEHEIQAARRESVLNSSILYALTAHIDYGGYSNPNDLPLIHHILVTCPNIRELDLSLSQAGCVVSDEQPLAFDFSSLPLASMRFPPLKVLKLNGYGLGNKFDGGKWMEWESSRPKRFILLWPWYHLPDNVINWIGYSKIHKLGGTMDYFRKRDRSPLPEGSKINLDGWLERMDWNHIHTLNLESVSPLVMQKLKPVLKELSSLTRPWKFRHRRLGLRHVAFNSFGPLVSAITGSHGQSLQSLELREREDLRGPYFSFDDESWVALSYDPHVYLSADDVSQLAQNCPILDSLDMDLNRTSNATVDEDVLNATTSFPSLKSLVLRLESPGFFDMRANPEINGHYIIGHDPIVNQTFVEGVFNRMRTLQGSLLSLQVHVGNWEDRSSRVSRMSHLVGHWHCGMDADGQEICEGRNEYSSYSIPLDEGPLYTNRASPVHMRAADMIEVVSEV